MQNKTSYLNYLSIYILTRICIYYLVILYLLYSTKVLDLDF